LYPLYKIASLEGLMHGLYLLWWVQYKHLDPVVVGAILAAGDLALMFFELPTGWFADRFGHRRSLITGSLIQVLGMVCCWIGPGVPGLLTASLLVALGDAFRSGADHALLYRTSVALGREDDVQHFEARFRAVQLAALVGLVLAGGAIVTAWGFAAGWMAEIVLCAIGAGFAFAMIEPPAVSALESDATTIQSSIISRTTLWLILPAGLVAALSGGAAFFLQTAAGRTAGELTVLVAAITLVEAAGAALATRLPVYGVRTQLSLTAMAIVLITTMVVFPVTGLIATLALSLLPGIAEPLRDAAVQRIAADDVRARVASFASVCDKAFQTAALPIAGWWRRRT
jgi:MFS family permease